MIGRPCKIDTTRFYRVIDEETRNIMLTAGNGCLTTGFHHMLAIYAQLHNQGYRPDMPLDRIVFNGYAENA